jgi:hypothetical protein
VPLELAKDRPRGKGREFDATIGVEPVDGLHDSDRRDLHQVVQWLTSVGEPPGQMLSQTKVLSDQLVAQTLIPGRRELHELFPFEP